MEWKYIAAMVIGILLLVALFGFVSTRTGKDSAVFNIFGDFFGKNEDTTISAPNPSCYVGCSMEISEKGGSIDDCIKNKCG